MTETDLPNQSSKQKTAASYAGPITQAKGALAQKETVANALVGMIQETKDLVDRRQVNSAEQYIGIIDKMNRKWSKMRKILLKHNIIWIGDDWYLRALFAVAPGVQEMIGYMAMSVLHGSESPTEMVSVSGEKGEPDRGSEKEE
jgi:hypothetical protein